MDQLIGKVYVLSTEADPIYNGSKVDIGLCVCVCACVRERS